LQPMTPQPEWDFEDHYDGAERQSARNQSVY